MITIMKRAYMAGLLVGIGVVATILVENIYISALLFSLALLTIIQNNLYLFTGKIGYVFNSDSTQDLKKLGIGLLLNFLGVYLPVLVLSPEQMNIVISIAASKFNESWYSLFSQAFFCGILMFVAVQSKKPYITILSIMTFILCGFEHCVADFAYFWHYIPYMTNLIPLGAMIVIILGNAIGSIFAFCWFAIDT